MPALAFGMLPDTYTKASALAISLALKKQPSLLRQLAGAAPGLNGARRRSERFSALNSV